MVPKLISKSVAGILILLVLGAMMVGQAAPASAGFTPTPILPPTDTPIAPTDTPIAPTDTPIPPTIAPTIAPTTAPNKPARPTATSIPQTATPTATPILLLPVSGGQAGGLNNEIIAVSLAGALVLLLAAISLVIRKSAETKNG